MIIDSAQVVLRDGTHKSAIDLFPGRDLLSIRSDKPARAIVTKKTTATSREVYRLLLSTGDTFCGDGNQPVALSGFKKLRFRPLWQIGIGERLRGIRAGMPTTVMVIGKSTGNTEERLVGIDTGGMPFVADGVLCK